MANCKHCGKWAGIFGDEHMDCAALAEKGMSAEQIKLAQQPLPPAPPAPLTANSIFWAVFGALCAFAVLFVIVHALTN